MSEIYVSTDIEADGPAPGPHSMLSIGSAAYLADKTLVASWSANLLPLEGASPHPETMKWWQTQPEAWEACQRDRRDPAQAIPEYAGWLEALPGEPVFVAHPAGFDFTFVYWYLLRFAGRSPFSFSALDIKSYAMALLKLPYRDCVKSNFPQRWFDELPHTHIALDDAIEQGAMFINMLREHLDG